HAARPHRRSLLELPHPRRHHHLLHLRHVPEVARAHLHQVPATACGRAHIPDRALHDRPEHARARRLSDARPAARHTAAHGRRAQLRGEGFVTLPNLVIAGAPKCGTSSLYRWLADHPEACGSRVKETFYLMDEGHPLLRRGSNFHTAGLEGYADFFGGCNGAGRVVFEATTHYIYQRTAFEVLSKLPARPRVVFLLRKPSERVYSSFRFSQNNLANVRPDLTFARFVELSKADAGVADWEEAAGASAFVLRNDIRYSRYVEYIAPWVERFGRGRVHVLLFEELKSNPRAFMKQFAARVGVDPAFYDAYDFPLK